VSHVKKNLFEQSGEAYGWRISYQRYLPGLVLKGEKGTAKLGAKTVLKQTNEICF
jgi:hypothetical protein